jgi:hypothetical protein
MSPVASATPTKPARFVEISGAVVPAQQGFERDDGPAVDLDLGLVPDVELPPVERATQLVGDPVVLGEGHREPILAGRRGVSVASTRGRPRAAPVGLSRPQ